MIKTIFKFTCETCGAYVDGPVPECPEPACKMPVKEPDKIRFATCTICGHTWRPQSWNLEPNTCVNPACRRTNSRILAERIAKEVSCLRCGYIWTPRTREPKKCPNPECQSKDWNRTEPKAPRASRVLDPLEQTMIMLPGSIKAALRAVCLAQNVSMASVFKTAAHEFITKHTSELTAPLEDRPQQKTDPLNFDDLF